VGAVSENIGGFVRNWWHVVVALVIVAGAWSRIETRLDTIATGQDAMRAANEALARDIRMIAENAAGAHITAQFTREALAELKGRVNDLERVKR
jgi:outer membrane murein-binding lipoprotein Lpp